MFETFFVVILLLTFLVPGFIWLSVESRFVYLDKRLMWEKFALELLTRSSLIYLPLSPLIYKTWKNSWYENHPFVVSFVAVALMFLLPVGMGVAWALICKKILKNVPLLEQLKKIGFVDNNIPTAWDNIFNDRRGNDWVIVTLKNNREVRGFMSDSSYVSSDYHERDIYISHVLKHGTLQVVTNTRGMYIPGDEISTIEFIEAPNEQTEQQKPSLDAKTNE